MVRLATEADAAALARIYAPFVEGSAVSFETEAPGPEEMAHRVRQVNARHAWLVYEDEGSVAGYAYGGPHRAREAYKWCSEVSVYMAPEGRGKGLARLLYDKLFKVLASLGYCTLYAGVTLPNGPSVRFHEACGFRPVGVFPQAGYKLGQWHDVGWWSLILQDEPWSLKTLSDVGELSVLLDGGSS